jgi:hypothetical protein
MASRIKELESENERLTCALRVATEALYYVVTFSSACGEKMQVVANEALDGLDNAAASDSKS